MSIDVKFLRPLMQFTQAEACAYQTARKAGDRCPHPCSIPFILYIHVSYLEKGRSDAPALPFYPAYPVHWWGNLSSLARSL